MTITRTPYCTKIRYSITGAPTLDESEMDGSHAPGVGVQPTSIELVYSAPRDGKPASVSASVTGDWMRFGKPDGGQVTTHFPGSPAGWPAWLAEEARLHDPAPPVVRPELRDQIAEALRPHASLGGTPLRYELPFFDGATPSLPRISGWKPLDDVVGALAAVLPATTNRAAVYAEAADECDKAGAAYAGRALNDHAAGAFALMETFLRKANEAEYVAAPCSVGGCEPGGEPCSTHERLMAHAEGDHELCQPDCDPRRMAVEAQQQTEPATQDAHSCGNCDGIDPDSCLMNPRRRHNPGALDRIHHLHDSLAAETDLSGPDDLITKGSASRRIAAALDGWSPEARPQRGDQFETWLKAQRDATVDNDDYWGADALLDQYRLHADTGTPLSEHVCEGKVTGDCECLERPAVVAAVAGEEPTGETSCPGFPDGCPTLIAAVPTVGSTHGGGLRCGCYDEPAVSQPGKEN